MRDKVEYFIYPYPSSLAIQIASTGWTTGEKSFICEPIDYTSNPKAMELLQAFYLGYYLKMFELVETLFFIMRKKFNQVTGLHIYHHISTYMLSYIGCRFLGGGMMGIPVMLNCFIHVLMYLYYYLSTFGSRWQKLLASVKPKLTLLQMIQFVIMIVHSFSVFLPTCPVSKKFLLFFVPNIVILFKMFFDFYRKAYNERISKKDALRIMLKVILLRETWYDIVVWGLGVKLKVQKSAKMEELTGYYKDFMETRAGM
ncbi:hypothetical protein NQ317_006983 [Molorchus minor]|uniref:Elongation of very long chain fatty acids protein n=1 Tax=Molorchus minor TaxID=1323400 RepID=A0ABQ9ISX0_9CUCU|nr:hypothetical protein NQ317_006983 [Molorchus minor]